MAGERGEEVMATPREILLMDCVARIAKKLAEIDDLLQLAGSDILETSRKVQVETDIKGIMKASEDPE